MGLQDCFIFPFTHRVIKANLINHDVRIFFGFRRLRGYSICLKFHRQADDSCLETDRGSSESREETPDSDSGYNAGGGGAAAIDTSASPKSAGTQKPRPVQIAQNFTPQQQQQQQQLSPNSLLNELRQRQQLQQQRGAPDLEAQYANLVTPPPPPRDQKPQAMVAAVMGPPPKGQQPGGFPGSPPGGGGGGGGGGGLGPTLADQLKNRLEERRRSQEETTNLSDPHEIQMRQAVKAANDAGNKGVRTKECHSIYVVFAD